MSDWEPGEYHKDPMVNAVLNVARELASVSESVHKLLYGLKYSEGDGMSIAEAIEVGCRSAGDRIGGAISDAANVLGGGSD